MDAVLRAPDTNVLFPNQTHWERDCTVKKQDGINNEIRFISYTIGSVFYIIVKSVDYLLAGKCYLCAKPYYIKTHNST